MSKRILVALVAIVLIVVAGMVVTMKRSMKAGALNREPDAAMPANPAPARNP